MAKAKSYFNNQKTKSKIKESLENLNNIEILIGENTKFHMSAC